MIRQYFASPFMGGHNPLRIGTIAVGAIYSLQDDCWWRDRHRGAPQHRDPWIVEAFLNGTVGAARRDPTTSLWQSLTIAGRSDLAIVRSLRNGRRCTIAVRSLRAHDDEGLSPEPTAYPSHPPENLVRRCLARRAGVAPQRANDQAPRRSGD